MKINKKGITLIEMIVSMALISVVLGFLLGLLVQLRKVDEKSLSALEYEEKIALITRFVQERISEDDTCTFAGSNTLTITCNDYKIEISNSFPAITVRELTKTGTETEKETYKFPGGIDHISSFVITTNEGNATIASAKIYDDLLNEYALEISYYKK